VRKQSSLARCPSRLSVSFTSVCRQPAALKCVKTRVVVDGFLISAASVRRQPLSSPGHRPARNSECPLMCQISAGRSWLVAGLAHAMALSLRPA